MWHVHTIRSLGSPGGAWKLVLQLLPHLSSNIWEKSRLKGGGQQGCYIPYSVVKLKWEVIIPSLASLPTLSSPSNVRGVRKATVVVIEQLLTY